MNRRQYQVTPTIPLAREIRTNKIVKVNETLPDQQYQCLDPECTGSLFITKNKRGTVFFKHHNGKAGKSCGFSSHFKKTTRRHEVAKRLLAIVFMEAIEHRMPYPILLVQHAGLSTFTTLCLNAATVVEEATCADSKRRADLALLDKHGEPVLLIEIFHTHAVDHNKRLDYSNTRWIEVCANSVIKNYEKLDVLHQGNVLSPLFDPQQQQLSLPGLTRAVW